MQQASLSGARRQGRDALVALALGLLAAAVLARALVAGEDPAPSAVMPPAELAEPASDLDTRSKIAEGMSNAWGDAAAGR